LAARRGMLGTIWKANEDLQECSYGGLSEHGSTESDRSHHRVMKHQKNPPHPGAHAPRPHAHLFLTIIKGRGRRHRGTSVCRRTGTLRVGVGHRGLRETCRDRIDPHQADTASHTSAPRARLTAAGCAIASHPRDHLPPKGQLAGVAPAMTPLGSTGAVYSAQFIISDELPPAPADLLGRGLVVDRPHARGGRPPSRAMHGQVPTQPPADARGSRRP
jgi:hypothetical protein